MSNNKVKYNKPQPDAVQEQTAVDSAAEAEASAASAAGEVQDSAEGSNEAPVDQAQADGTQDTAAGAEEKIEETADVVDQAPAETPPSEAPAAPVAAAEPIKEVEQVVEVAPEAIEPPAGVKPAKVEVPSPSQSNKSEEEEYLDKIRVDGTIEQKRMLAAIETFAGRMVPRVAIEPEKCVSYQYEFLSHLLWLLDKEYEVFRGGWNVLLVYFQLHHGSPRPDDYTALSEISVSRHIYAWTRGTESCNAYLNLITLLRATRNKATRATSVKMISIDKIGPSVLSEKAVSNLRQFYNV